jgi:type IV secretory pathway VirJ component
MQEEAALHNVAPFVDSNLIAGCPAVMKIALKILGIAGALTIAAYLILSYAVGYFGGRLFFDVPARAPSKPGEEQVAAIVFSGNMGFHVGQALKVSNGLAARGLPVVGVNSLTYFAGPRTPAEATAFVEAAIDRAVRDTHRDKVALIGISFGADILHVGLAGLPPSYRAKVHNVVLVVPGAILQLQASPLEVMSFRTPDRDGTMTARQLVWTPVTCIWGAEEKDSLCPILRQPNVRHVALPGGHMLDRKVDVLTAQVMRAIDTAAARQKFRSS